jgi:hypothetical protein
MAAFYKHLQRSLKRSGNLTVSPGWWAQWWALGSWDPAGLGNLWTGASPEGERFTARADDGWTSVIARYYGVDRD